MPDIVIPVSALSKGNRVIFEGDLDPITHISALKIIPRRVNAPDGVLMTVELMAPRNFWWVRISDGASITVGSVSSFTRPAGFQFDVFAFTGQDQRLMAVWIDMPRDRSIVTDAFILVDWTQPATGG